MNDSSASPALPSLVESDWLQTHLDDPDIRILECTVRLTPGPDGWRIESGYDAWNSGHIPGSRFVDLIHELSAPHAELLFMMPSAEQVAEHMARHGVGEGTRVILYDRAKSMWAARVWWILRYFGFDQAAILNGGWHKWCQEGRAISTEPSDYPPASFSIRLRPELLASKEEVLSNIGDDSICLIHTLDPESYRQQRIPGSVNVPALALLDPETESFLPLQILRQRFTQAGALGHIQDITYCRAGVLACVDAFLLTLLGQTNVAVYDGSLSEWTKDAHLPLDHE